MLVVVLDVGTGLALGTTCLDGAILQDYPVIATASPALGTVIAVEVIDSDLLADTGGGTARRSWVSSLSWGLED